MSRNIIVLLIMGVLTFGFTKPSTTPLLLDSTLLNLKDSVRVDSLQSDSLLSDSSVKQKALNGARIGLLNAKIKLNKLTSATDSFISDSSMRRDAVNEAQEAIRAALAKLENLVSDSINSKDTITSTKEKETEKTFIYGTASYYHNMFVGRPTATGDIFKQSKMTCAHRTIPLKSWVRVTRMDNGKSVVLYVNDRMGKSPHEIDLTTAAAKKLGYINAGWTKVKIEVIPKPRKKTSK